MYNERIRIYGTFYKSLCIEDLRLILSNII